MDIVSASVRTDSSSFEVDSELPVCLPSFGRRNWSHEASTSMNVELPISPRYSSLSPIFRPGYGGSALLRTGEPNPNSIQR